jgi:hypothetical protein
VGQDAEHREGAHRPRTEQRQDIAIILALGAGYWRRVRRNPPALQQDHHHVRRRRGRPAHCHLLLTFFFRYMRPLVECGHVFIARPPLFLVQKGKQKRYVYNENERDDTISEMGSKGLPVQRYKGLGEMNPEQLWETTMDPERRILTSIKIEGRHRGRPHVHHSDGRRRGAAPRVIETHARYADVDV